MLHNTNQGLLPKFANKALRYLYENNKEGDLDIYECKVKTEDILFLCLLQSKHIDTSSKKI